MTAVHISDLHLTTVHDVHLRMLEQVQALKPDLIFVTGDFIDQDYAIAAAVELFNNLKAPGGIWAVLGNWDHTSGAVGLLIQELASVGVRFLINESAQLESGLWLVGVDDPATWRDRLTRAVDNVPSGIPRILLAHSPDIAAKVHHTTVDLILVGHTHGGQINLPFFNGASLHRGIVGRYPQGFYQVYGSTMYVNRGIGTTTLPVRIGARPEITHFRLSGA
jgi:predicted MPP superfamily phosphohydrolase